ncbi:PoNe immunity protein domain-containing protein [Photobacterium atrarenae]|uniref:DUF1911 domain-containing protein n=1 Tax=Photobacterium atrarenae TaxID=865757 RepID=A0ABY5GBC0_9GAMM|nr:PoNe immunity protein domain-containing protein [Photobacterium atrarenae]UTV26481.1 DUF1911 domain-containing protein [Photobacterium atrarenae]
MLRDTRRPHDYFSELLTDLDEAIEETQQALDEDEFPLPAEQVDAAQQLYQLAIMRAVAHYSAGATRAQLKPVVESILPLRRQLKDKADALPDEHQVYRRPFEQFGLQAKADGSDNVNRYIYALWWLSLLVACQVDSSHIAAALDLINNSGRDALLDRVAISLGDSRRDSGAGLLYPERYQPLYDAFDAAPEQRPALVRTFLESWYANNADTDWYESHLCDCEFVYTDYYTGYWCFEALLVANLLNIDDKLLKTHPHYPKDLALSAG